jgi:RimJ/RimL family protein N-acetyltransferase
MTVVGNVASLRVMERLGMTRSIEFDHPHFSADSPLRRHVLYRVQKPARSQPDR